MLLCVGVRYVGRSWSSGTVSDGLAAEWPSLVDQLDFIGQFFGSAGQKQATDSLQRCLAAQIETAVQVDSYRRYSVPGSAPADYGPRSVTARNGSVFGEIHVHRGDIAGPFVDVVAHSFEDLDELLAVVATEWSVFSPRFLRLQCRPGRIRRPNSLVWRTIYAARAVDMSDPDGCVELSRFRDVDDAVALASEWEDAEIEYWQESRHLWAIRAGGEVVGGLVISPSPGDRIPAYEVVDKFVAPEHRGYGHSAAAQAVWAKMLASSDPSAVLLGSINPNNHASVRSAIRAGRRAVLDTVLVGLEEVTDDCRRPVGGAISEPHRGRRVSRSEECPEPVAYDPPTS